MRTETSHNHQGRFLGILKDIFSRARIYGMTHDAMLEEFGRRLYGDAAWKKVPGHVRAFIGGYHSALREEDYRHHLTWRVFLDGKYIDPDDVPAGRWKDVISEAGCHFWKGNGKPFGDARPETAAA